MKNIKILGIALLLILIIVVAINLNKDSQSNEEGETVVNIEGEPIDSAIDFYDAWLMAVNDETKDPYTEGLSQSEFLSVEMQERINTAQADFQSGTSDPVLCQTETLPSIRSKVVSVTETDAQILILGPRKDAQAISIVKLAGIDGMWKITDINCNAGETAPERGEFDFEREGFLLKQSVKPPLNPENWYVVYESNGVMGYTAVLNFSENSSCTINGETKTCGDETFYEAMKVKVAGNMTEAGVDVVRVEAAE